MANNIVSLSFKNNLEEMNLYTYLKSKSSPSAYIKDLIKQDIGDAEEYVKNNKIRSSTDNIKQKEEPINKPKLTTLSSICK